MAMSFCLSVRPSVRLFVSLSPVKFVKSFARGQHLAASEGLSYRVRYSCVETCCAVVTYNYLFSCVVPHQIM